MLVCIPLSFSISHTGQGPNPAVFWVPDGCLKSQQDASLILRLGCISASDIQFGLFPYNGLGGDIRTTEAQEASGSIGSEQPHRTNAAQKPAR